VPSRRLCALVSGNLEAEHAYAPVVPRSVNTSSRWPSGVGIAESVVTGGPQFSARFTVP
jgi:hypothetical protein